MEHEPPGRIVGISYIWSADAAAPSGSRTMRKLGLGAMPQRGLVLCNGGSVYESKLTRSRRSAPDERAPRLWFDADVVVHGSANPLLAAEAFLLGRLYNSTTPDRRDRS